MFPGPYLCYYDVPLESKIRAAQQYISDIVEEEGPFDGILGFSQGAALAASILLERERLGLQHRPYGLAFRFAVFICATRPWDVNHSRLIDVGDRTSISSYTEFDDVASLDGDVHGLDTSMTAIQILSQYEAKAGFSISIPCVHIMGGQKDPDMKESEGLLQLCRDDLMKVVNHDCGHTVPRSQVENERMVDCILWAIEKSKFQFFG